MPVTQEIAQREAASQRAARREGRPLDRLMLDLGAHDGTDSAYYLHRGWKVVAVEAHPGLARGLTDMFHLCPLECRVVNRAISPEGKEARLYVSDKGLAGETHSIFPDKVKRCEPEGYTVPGTTVGKLFDLYGVPFYMKVDIEGADVLAMRQLHEWSKVGRNVPPAYLSVELSWDHPEETLEIFSHLAYMGYDLFRLADQFNPEGIAKTVPLETSAHAYYTLHDMLADWFDGPPLEGHWFDLHARHSTANEATYG